MSEKKRSVFEVLNAKDVNEHVETKGDKTKLKYLSWAWAWAEVKKEYPLAFYTIYENESGWNYFTDGRYCWVKTGMTIEGLEHIEYLPIMNYSNKSIPLKDVTSMDVNKAIQRSLTKAAARHGLGLYIYAGEDLPEDSEETPNENKATNNNSGVRYGKDVSELKNNENEQKEMITDEQRKQIIAHISDKFKNADGDAETIKQKKNSTYEGMLKHLGVRSSDKITKDNFNKALEYIDGIA